ncbi:hypothetical protein CNR22_04095 [Sphingobacteriaceae bacterium]|nr:hypothetical protein CNR22_04095 [Sphingobacteriaceae bacterium]
METTNYDNFSFEEICLCDYATVTYCENLKMAICTATSDYIPISDFKTIFLKISEYIDNYPINYFLFDKRSLRTFHQPSMEWYFAVWKPEMKMKGLCDHFKILPKLDWFEKAVEAGKHEIFQKYGKDILAGISVTYVQSVEGAIDSIVSAK